MSHKPKEAPMLAAKRVIHSLKGTIEMRVFYKRRVKYELLAYIDNDYACDIDDRKASWVTWSSTNDIYKLIVISNFSFGGKC